MGEQGWVFVEPEDLEEHWGICPPDIDQDLCGPGDAERDLYDVDDAEERDSETWHEQDSEEWELDLSTRAEEQDDILPAPTFEYMVLERSPVLRDVWENSMARYYVPAWRGPPTPLQEATRKLYGPRFGRGTAHAIGIWADCDSPVFSLRVWYWLRRQGEMLWVFQPPLW